MAKHPQEEEGQPQGFDRWILPFFTDSTLWPVTAVAVAILVTFGSAIVLFAVFERNPFALAALAILVVMSADVVWRDVRRRRRAPGALGRLVLTVWCLVAVASTLAARSGLF